MIKNADYFRKLQGTKSLEELVKEDIDKILNKIENYIINGGKETILSFNFILSKERCQKLIDTLKNEYGFKVYCSSGTLRDNYKLEVSWK
jgi:hypothetical protein